MFIKQNLPVVRSNFIIASVNYTHFNVPYAMHAVYLTETAVM